MEFRINFQAYNKTSKLVTDLFRTVDSKLGRWKSNKGVYVGYAICGTT